MGQTSQIFYWYTFDIRISHERNKQSIQHGKSAGVFR
jgi:hypothetical protein